jgi:hypothetical protein
MLRRPDRCSAMTEGLLAETAGRFSPGGRMRRSLTERIGFPP